MLKITTRSLTLHQQAIHEDEDENIGDCRDRIKLVLEDKHEKFYQRILQLVMADGAYCEGCF